MKRTWKKLMIWMGMREARWWDRDEENLNMIQGEALAAALNHRRACA